MASAVARARAILDQLKPAVAANPSQAKSLLTQFKLTMTEFPSQTTGELPSAEEAAVAREALEYGVILCTKTGDMKGFERNVQMLKPLYASSSEAPAAAEARRQVLGLYLAHLLVEANLPAFHAEVELLRPEDKASPYIAFVLQLENSFAEGAYNRILSASSALPSEFFAPFVAQLAGTAREDIADCAAVSYKSLSLDAAQKLFMLRSRAELLHFLAEKRPEFLVEGDVIRFEVADKARSEVDALALLGTTLEYATELERIV